MTRIIAIHSQGETFGLPVHVVGPVLRVDAVTRAPLAGEDFAGLYNMRGKILPLIDLRRKLDPSAPPVELPALAICIDAEQESYAVTIDDVGDVHTVSSEQRVDLPAHAGARRAHLTAALFRTPSGFLPVLDPTRLFEPLPHERAEPASLPSDGE